jgi:hypothetical protein
MSLRGAGCCLLLWLACAWSGLAAQAAVEPAPALEVTLVTVEPGELYWQRFGHNAILVRDPASGVSVSYNFGYFDFAQQDFLLRFIRGRMLYQAVAIDGDLDLDGYLADGRRVWLQRLRLSDVGARRLATHLHQHVQPQHRDYRYDYYRINCSTKVRDALDLALDGALRRATEHRSHGWSYRRFTRAYAQGIPWLYFGTDLALGQAVDAPLSLWEEAFIPGELKRQVGELKLDDGQPLVIDEQVLPAGADPIHPAPQAPDWRAGFAAAGIAVAGLLMLLARLAERGGLARVPLAFAGLLLALVLGSAGLLIFGLWIGTDHASAWRNENLLLVSPFWWLTVPAWLLLLRRDDVSGWVARAAVLGGWLAFAGVALGALLKVFRSFDQANIEWLLLMLPLVLALRHVLARRCI